MEVDNTAGDAGGGGQAGNQQAVGNQPAVGNLTAEQQQTLYKEWIGFFVFNAVPISIAERLAGQLATDGVPLNQLPKITEATMIKWRWSEWERILVCHIQNLLKKAKEGPLDHIRPILMHTFVAEGKNGFGQAAIGVGPVRHCVTVVSPTHAVMAAHCVPDCAEPGCVFNVFDKDNTAHKVVLQLIRRRKDGGEDYAILKNSGGQFCTEAQVLPTSHSLHPGMDYFIGGFPTFADGQGEQPSLVAGSFSLTEVGPHKALLRGFPGASPGLSGGCVCSTVGVPCLIGICLAGYTKKPQYCHLESLFDDIYDRITEEIGLGQQQLGGTYACGAYGVSTTSEKKTGMGSNARAMACRPTGNECDLPIRIQWSQTPKVVILGVPLPAFPPKSDDDYVVEVSKQHIKVGLKGEPPVLKGRLHAEVNDRRIFWKIDKNMVLVKLEKMNETEWSKLIDAYPEINTRRMQEVPETDSLQSKWS